MPKLSIIVPIYKVENYLKQCVDSIISQNFRDLEIILVDDGSPDNCPAICDEYTKKDSRIKVVHKPNGGLVSARKAGLEIATGEYITYVDGDDWIASDMYDNMICAINQTACDIAITGFLGDYGDRFVPVINKIKVGNYSSVSEKTYLYEHMLYSGEFYSPGIYPMVWNKLFRRELLYPYQMNVPNNISMGEDVAVTYLCLLHAKSIVITDDCKYYYRANPNAMTKKYDKAMFQKMSNLVTYLNETLVMNEYRLDWQMKKYYAYLLLYGSQQELSLKNRLHHITHYARIRGFMDNIDFVFQQVFDKNERKQIGKLERNFLRCLSNNNFFGAEIIGYMKKLYRKLNSIKNK